jgi:hypothetical protein
VSRSSHLLRPPHRPITKHLLFHRRSIGSRPPYPPAHTVAPLARTRMCARPCHSTIHHSWHAQGNTPLHEAPINKQLVVYKQLLGKGPDVNAKGKVHAWPSLLSRRNLYI